MYYSRWIENVGVQSPRNCFNYYYGLEKNFVIFVPMIKNNMFFIHRTICFLGGGISLQVMTMTVQWVKVRRPNDIITSFISYYDYTYIIPSCGSLQILFYIKCEMQKSNPDFLAHVGTWYEVNAFATTHKIHIIIHYFIVIFLRS